ncbi:MAG: leucine-rich repeat domain-containing protein, partial [Lentimicrobiaceae bacterium]|nr:leucine-rich repeat domain-containing protein [Lentimicrobiaceae bacterium]
MKRLLSLLGLLLVFALPNHAQTDTIKFEVTLWSWTESATLEYEFSEQARNSIRIEWISSNSTESGKFSPDADGKYTQSITGSGTGYIYYTYEQGSTYSAYLSYRGSSNYYDIKVIDRQGINTSVISPLITSLDVSACTALRELRCSNNQLTSLDVSGCTSLTKLNCGYNPLRSLDVSGCTALTTLDCINLLTSLDVSGCTALKELTDITVDTLKVHGKSMNTLVVGGKIKVLDANACTSLTSLNCSNNQLTSLDVSGCTHLMYLSCYNNQLRSLDLSQDTALTTLYCDGNQLTSLGVSQNTALTTLYCDNNQLTELDVSHNTDLTTLSCSDNQLTILDISKNTALLFLRCYNNQLTTLDISNNIRLTGLYCSENQLTSLDVSHNTDLTRLGCADNQLSTLDLSNNIRLEGLSCYKNQLTVLDVSHNIDLTTLSCSDNQLTTLDIRSNIRLTELWCDTNHIPLSELYKTAYQRSNWSCFGAFGQMNTIILPLNQVLDLSSERILGGSLSTYELSYASGNGVSSDVYTEGNFNFRFKKPGEYRLRLENSTLPTADFTWYISVTGEDVATESHENDNFYVYAQDRNIVLSETRGAVQVFNAVGQCVYSGNATIIPV